MTNWEALYIPADDLTAPLAAITDTNTALLGNAADCEERASVLRAEAEALEEQAERLRSLAAQLDVTERSFRLTVEWQQRAEAELNAFPGADWLAIPYGASLYDAANDPYRILI